MRKTLFLLLVVSIYFWIVGKSYAQSADSTAAFDNELEALLNEEHASVASGTSTAAKFFQSTLEAPSSVSIITAEEIQRFGYRNFAEVLRSIRGVYLSYDRFWHYVGTRGFGRPTDYNNRILLLVNGHSVNNNIFGAGPFGSNLAIDMNMIDRVEVIRGPGSALYGTNAMFGVINIITKDGKTLDGAVASVSYGEWDKKKFTLSGGKEIKGIDFALSGSFAESDGDDLFFPEYGGTAQGLDWEKYKGINLRMNYKNLFFQGLYATRDKGIPNAPYQSDFGDDHCEGEETNGFMELKYVQNLGVDKSLTFRGYANFFKYDSYYPFSYFPLPGSDPLPLYFRSHAYFEGNYWGGEGQFKWEMGLNNRLTMGVAYRDNYKAENEFEYIFDSGQYAVYEPAIKPMGVTNPYKDKSRGGDFPSSVTSFYIQDEYIPWEQLSFTIGLRRDEYSDLGENVKNQTMPRFAIVFFPNRKSSLKLLYGQAYRVPNADELNFEKVGIINNDTLSSELIKTVEMVYEQKINQNFSFTGALYYYKMEDLIDKKPVSLKEVKFYNESELKANGLELGVHYRSGNNLMLYGNYLWQKSENETSDEEQSNSPRHLLKLGASYYFFDLFYMSTELFYESERYCKDRSKTDGFLLTDIYMKTRPLGKYFSLFFRMNNLFDEKYDYPAGFEHFKSTRIRQDGRSFLAGLQFHI